MTCGTARVAQCFKVWHDADMTNEKHKVGIADVKIDALTRTEVLKRIGEMLGGDVPCFMRIATVNPDFVLRARSGESFARVLAAADLRVAEGVGIAWAARLAEAKIERYPGSDLLADALELARSCGWHVQIFARADGLSSVQDIEQMCAREYADLQVTVAAVACDESVSQLTQKQKRRPTLYICNCGVPVQEELLESLRDQDAWGVAIGVGGALDFLTGRVARAPRWMVHFGLEWVWRTAAQPRRIGKALRSVIVFPVVILVDLAKKKYDR